MNRYAKRNDLRESGHTFVGAGVAWTPIDEEPNGRLLSVQFGVSRDAATQEAVGDAVKQWSGGWALMAQPALVWSTRPGMLWFASTAVPLVDRWRDPADRELFRVGAGVIISFGR